MLNEAQLSELGQQGYEAVINLLPPDNDYSLPNEQAIVEQQTLSYHNIGVDFSNPTQKNFQDFCSTLSALGHKKILIHCAANYRASAFYSVYAIQKLGWTELRAKLFVESVWNICCIGVASRLHYLCSIFKLQVFTFCLFLHCIYSLCCGPHCLT